jgi:hypothetical protein
MYSVWSLGITPIGSLRVYSGSPVAASSGGLGPGGMSPPVSAGLFISNEVASRGGSGIAADCRSGEQERLLRLSNLHANRGKCANIRGIRGGGASYLHSASHITGMLCPSSNSLQNSRMCALRAEIHLRGRVIKKFETLFPGTSTFNLPLHAFPER